MCIRAMWLKATYLGLLWQAVTTMPAHALAASLAVADCACPVCLPGGLLPVLLLIPLLLTMKLLLTVYVSLLLSSIILEELVDGNSTTDANSCARNDAPRDVQFQYIMLCKGTTIRHLAETASQKHAETLLLGSQRLCKHVMTTAKLHTQYERYSVLQGMLSARHPCHFRCHGTRSQGLTESLCTNRQIT